MLDSDVGLLSFPFPAIETGFTIWDFHIKNPQVLLAEEEEEEKPVVMNSGPYEPAIDDERRLRRMKSNRESAQRSRLRKQKHVENLKGEMNRLINGKNELLNRLEFVLEQNRIMKRENDGLTFESEKLRQRVWDMHQILILKHLSHNNNNNNFN